MTTSQLKKGLSIAGFILALLLLIAYGSNAEEPTWIQFNERLAGANSPDYTDVLNRPVKEFWQLYTLEHNEDGTHKGATPLNLSTFSIEHNLDGTHKNPPPLTSDELPEGTSNLYYTEERVYNNSLVVGADAHRYNTSNPHAVSASQAGAVSLENQYAQWTLKGNGVGALAQYNGTETGYFTGGTSLSIWAGVRFFRWGVRESIVTYLTGNEQNLAVDFFKDSADKLAVTIGANTYTSDLEIMYSDRMLEVGVSLDGSQAWFFMDGKVSDAQPVPFAAQAPDGLIRIGHVLSGIIGYVSFSECAVLSPGQWYSPFKEGEASCPCCLGHYNMNQVDTFIADHNNNRQFNVTDGTWYKYADGF